MELADRMYDPGPSDTELAAIGICREDVQDDSICEIWPENNEAFQLFYQVQSQWRIGPAGRTSLDYNVAFSLMNLMGIKKKRQLRLIEDIKTLEMAALERMYKD